MDLDFKHSASDSKTQINDSTELESRFLVTRIRLESRWERLWLESSHVENVCDSNRVTFFTEWLCRTWVTFNHLGLQSE